MTAGASLPANGQDTPKDPEKGRCHHENRPKSHRPGPRTHRTPTDQRFLSPAGVVPSTGPSQRENTDPPRSLTNCRGSTLLLTCISAPFFDHRVGGTRIPELAPSIVSRSGLHAPIDGHRGFPALFIQDVFCRPPCRCRRGFGSQAESLAARVAVLSRGLSPPGSALARCRWGRLPAGTAIRFHRVRGLAWVSVGGPVTADSSCRSFTGERFGVVVTRQGWTVSRRNGWFPGTPLELRVVLETVVPLCTEVRIPGPPQQAELFVIR